MEISSILGSVLIKAKRSLARHGGRVACLWLTLSLSGCAAMTNPVADSLPARRFPPELLAESKDDEHTIPLTMLRQPAPDAYRLAPTDVLGIWIEGVLGEKAQAVPVNTAPLVQTKDQRRLAPSAGYPITVRPDGTIVLPQLDPVMVRGLTVDQVEDMLRKLYTEKQILPAGRERVQVTLLYPRQHQVLVLRQESPSFFLAPEGFTPTGKRGTGQIVELPAYENDVLHALTLTGGLPGLDAYNAVFIFRGLIPGSAEQKALMKELENLRPGSDPRLMAGTIGKITRIPLRVHPGEEPPITLDDIVLHTGDVVFVEARDKEVYFTGGLLPAGEHVLPRDRDLDVIAAVSQVRGPLVNGAFATNSLSGNLIQPGIGGPSPSLLIVVRKTPGGGQVPIRVDLNRALRDPRERILVKAGDVLLLQEKPGEASARYLTQTFFNVNILWRAISTPDVTGIVDVAAPQRTGPGAITVTP